MKRFLSIFLAAILIFGMLPIAVLAQEESDSGTCGDNLTWAMDEAGILTISGTGAMDDFRNGSAPWFDLCDSISTIIIESGITSIGDFAFYGFSELTNISLPEGLSTIGSSVFEGCHSLTDILIPDSVTAIGSEVFVFCRNLESIRVGENNPNYSSLDGVLFNKDQTQLLRAPGALSGDYTVPGQVTAIADQAFKFCKQLTAISIPGSVTAIGKSAFANCTRMTAVTFDADAPTFGASAFVNVAADVSYPADNETWTADVMQNYGGTLNWISSGVEAPEPPRTPGDVTGDDLVDDFDVAMLLWHVLFPDMYKVDDQADFNGDGLITDQDVAYLLWHILFPDAYPL